MRKENLLGDTEKECLENGEKREWAIRKNGKGRQGQLEGMAGYQLELEAIKRQAEGESLEELCRKPDVTEDAETVETET